jgi:iron(III) transport system substrate-binding protein
MAFSRSIATLFLLAAAHTPLAVAQANRPNPAEVDALIKAAKAEGEIVIYGSSTDNVLKRVGDAFTAAYGIKHSFIRLSSTPLMQRYSAEASAGNIAADLLMAAGGVQAFAADGIKKGWLEPVVNAGIPVMKSGQYPAAFNRNDTAIVSILLWAISYNTDKVKGADIPRDWPDLLNPKWKGQILLPEPRSTDAVLDVMTLVYDKYGEDFFTKLRAQSPRWYASQVPMLQALGAGEGSIGLPTNETAAQLLVSKGSPIGTIAPPVTTGVEMQISLTARGKAKHPNAARLYANFVLSPEGNKIYNADPGSYSVYDSANIPKGYESPKPGVSARAALVNRILGVQ